MRVGSAEMIALESTSSVKRCSKFPGNSPYPDAPDGAQCRSMLRGIDIRAVVDHAERAVILPWFWWSRQGWAQSPDGHVFPLKSQGHGPTRIELRSAEY